MVSVWGAEVVEFQVESMNGGVKVWSAECRKSDV